MKGNGSIDNSRGVWSKKTFEKVKKKKRDRDEKRPFRFSVRILIYFRERPLFPVRGRFTLRTSIVYGRIFTTQTPFYNVAISKVYSPQQPANGTIVGGFGPYNTYWPCVDFYFSGYRVVYSSYDVISRL